jgi:hypothetical protein
MRTKTTARKKVAKPYTKWALQDYIELRKTNPYLVNRHPRFTNTHFHNSTQEAIYNDCYIHPKFRVVPQHYLSIDHMLSKPAYFGGASEMVEELGLENIMRFRCHYDQDLVCQFYATVFFTTTKPQKILWMSRDKYFETT